MDSKIMDKKKDIRILALAIISTLIIAMMTRLPKLLLLLIHADVSGNVLNLIKSIFKFILAGTTALVIRNLLNEKVKIGKRNMVKGIFLYGTIVVIATVLQFIVNFYDLEKGIMEAMPSLLLLIIQCISVGVYEEILCRGLLFTAFRNYFGEGKKKIFLAILLSGLVFGLLHLTNLINRPDQIMSVLLQVVYTTVGGIVFAFVYYRTDNLLPCIILHTLFNFSGTYWKCFV